MISDTNNNTAYTVVTDPKITILHIYNTPYLMVTDLRK